MTQVTLATGEREEIAPTPRTLRRHWLMPWRTLAASVVILVGVGVFLYPQVASWFSQREQSRATEVAQAQLEEPPNDNPVVKQVGLDVAHAYNDALASGAILNANAHVAVGDGTSTDESLVYGDILNATGSGFMGRLLYSALAIDLPIYHGTSDQTLEHGVGHLEGTSLPVGGIGTRAVLTAHRGLASAKLFTDLDKAQMGDTFTVSVLDQVLTYQVVDIQVIQPEDTEELLADPNRDLVTLVTCTPLGINSHRILVTAQRVTPTPERDVVAAHAKPDLPGFPWWAVILGAVVLALAAYVWAAGRQSADGPATASGATDLRRARMSPTATVPPPPARTETIGGATMAAEDAAGAQQNFVDEAVAKTKETYENISQTVGGALDSDQAEQVTDSILDTVSDFAKKILPEQTHAKIDEVRDQVDGAVGQ